MLPEPAEQPTLDAAEVAAALGIGVTLTRQLGRRFIASGGAEGVPCVAYGRKLRYPTAAVRKHLGMDGGAPARPARFASEEHRPRSTHAAPELIDPHGRP